MILVLGVLGVRAYVQLVVSVRSHFGPDWFRWLLVVTVVTAGGGREAAGGGGGTAVGRDPMVTARGGETTARSGGETTARSSTATGRV